MLIIPAVDIMGGKSVRLVHGDPSRKKIYYDDPLLPATKFAKAGAERVHVVDLDAALGTGQNLSSIKRIVSMLRLPVQVGGGIRSLDRARRLLDIGVARVIFGTSSVNQIEIVASAIKEFGPDRIAAAVDARGDLVVVKGWTEPTGLNYIELAESLDRLGVGSIIFTSVDADGTLTRPSLERVMKLCKIVATRLIASGGVSTLEDIRGLAETGAYGAIIGTALYEEKVDLAEAMRVASEY
jgi:phosphoribosylformimino-5-aminoimidazole carboxamide ribotide isomerase